VGVIILLAYIRNRRAGGTNPAIGGISPVESRRRQELDTLILLAFILTRIEISIKIRLRR